MPLRIITDEQWNNVIPLLKDSEIRNNQFDYRLIVSGILHMISSGDAWSRCPRGYGEYWKIKNTYYDWKKNGRWTEMFEALNGRVFGSY
jgi:transposase